MLLTRIDLERLEEHTRMFLDDDQEVGIIWRCFTSKTIINFVDVEIEVDYGIELKLVTIDRPYCSYCNPEAKIKPDIFLPSLIEPLPYEYLVSLSRYPTLSAIK